MDSLPAWWTFFGHPDFCKQTFYFAWPELMTNLEKLDFLLHIDKLQNAVTHGWLSNRAGGAY